MEIFAHDIDGKPREMRKLMNRRNYIAIVAYDPEAVQGAFGNTDMTGTKTSKLSLAVDFMVQGESGVPVGGYGGVATTGVVKYGPVIVPSLEFGR